MKGVILQKHNQPTTMSAPASINILSVTWCARFSFIFVQLFYPKLFQINFFIDESRLSKHIYILREVSPVACIVWIEVLKAALFRRTCQSNFWNLAPVWEVSHPVFGFLVGSGIFLFTIAKAWFLFAIKAPNAWKFTLSNQNNKRTSRISQKTSKLFETGTSPAGEGWTVEFRSIIIVLTVKNTK